MGLGLACDDNENYRIRLKLSYERLKELSSYIRITDGAIWGFLGVTFIEIFKDDLNNPLPKIAFFSSLVIISMIIWRRQIGKYQKGILKEYETIKDYEVILKFDDKKHSMTYRHKKDLETGKFILIKGQLTDPAHLYLDKSAEFIAGLAGLYLFTYSLAFFANFKPYICGC